MIDLFIDFLLFFSSLSLSLFLFSNENKREKIERAIGSWAKQPFKSFLEQAAADSCVRRTQRTTSSKWKESHRVADSSICLEVI